MRDIKHFERAENILMSEPSNPTSTTKSPGSSISLDFNRPYEPQPLGHLRDNLRRKTSVVRI